MTRDNYEKLLETFRRSYFDPDFSMEKSQRVLEKKAALLNVDYSEVKRLIDDLLKRYMQFEEICEEYVVDGKITKSGLAEIEELKEDLNLTEEEKDNLVQMILEKATIEEASDSEDDEDEDFEDEDDDNEDDEDFDEEDEEDDNEDDEDFDDEDEDEHSEIVSHTGNNFSLLINGSKEEFTLGASAANDWLYDKFEKIYVDLSKEFMKGYRSFGSLENMISNIDDLFEEYVYRFSEKVVEELSSDDILEYSETDICENVYNDYGGFFEEAKDKVFDFLAQMQENTEALDNYRTARRQSRGKFIGFGTEGIMKAGAANMATGAVHGVFNLLGKGITSISNSVGKSNMYKEMETEFEKSYFAIWVGMYDVMCLIYTENNYAVANGQDIKERKGKSVAVIENTLKASNNIDKILAAVKNSLQLYYYNNFKALDLLLEVAISTQSHSLQDNMFNLKVLSEVVKNKFNVYPDSNIANRKYLDLLQQIRKADFGKDEKKRLLKAMEQQMDWNSSNHNDLKREFIFENRDANFIEITGEVNKPIGNAFRKVALDIYNSCDMKPFGDKFLCCLEDKFDEKARAACNSYVNIVDSSEQPVFIYDDTFTGSSKAGIFITDKRIYMKDMNPIRVDEVKTVAYERSFGVTYIELNGFAKTSLTYVPDKTIENLKQFMTSIFGLSSLELSSPNVTAQLMASSEAAATTNPVIGATTARPAAQTAQALPLLQSFAAASSGVQTQTQAQVSSSPAGSAANTDCSTLARNFVGSISATDMKSQIFYFNENDKVNVKFRNAFAAYAKLTQYEIPLILFDNTAMGGAKDGFIITNKRIYAHNMWADSWALDLNTINDVNCKGSSLTLGGKSVDINLIRSKDRDMFCNFVRNVIFTLVKNNY